VALGPKTPLETATASAAENGTTLDKMATPATNQMPNNQRRYRWCTGDCLASYGMSAKTWRAYSSTDEFSAAFKAIIEDENMTNDERADRVEEFLLE
jgi:hypothetical protein